MLEPPTSIIRRSPFFPGQLRLDERRRESILADGGLETAT
jgi:hypothetical protein